MTRASAVAAILIALLLAPMVAESQLPRGRAKYPNSMSTRQIREYVQSATFARTVTVDSSGVGDFATIKAACDYVAGQSGRSEATQWTILVYPGKAGASLSYADMVNYQEDPFTVPSFTSVQGVPSGHNTPVGWTGSPIIQFTGTTGAMLTLNAGSSLTNLAVVYLATPASAVNVVRVATDALAVLTNVSVTVLSTGDTAAAVGIKNDGALYAYETSVSLSGLLASGSRAVWNASATAGGGASIYGGRMIGESPCAGLLVSDGAGSGGLKLYDVRIDSGCTNDIVNSSSTVRMIGTPYLTASGAVSGTLTHGGSTLPTTCAASDVYLDKTTFRVCACTATNTWKCAQTKIVSATAPYACASGVAGDQYYDTTTPTPCWCNGSAWQPVADGGNCS